MKIRPISPVTTYYNNTNKREKERQLWYCYHCGCKNYTGDWYFGKCPKCGASTPPKKW